MNVTKNIILFAAFATILNATEITDRASIIYNSCAKNSKDTKISNHKLKNIDSYAKLIKNMKKQKIYLKKFMIHLLMNILKKEITFLKLEL